MATPPGREKGSPTGSRRTLHRAVADAVQGLLETVTEAGALTGTTNEPRFLRLQGGYILRLRLTDQYRRRDRRAHPWSKRGADRTAKTARPMASRCEHIKFPRAQMGEMSENLFSGCSAPSCGLSNCDTTKIRTQDEKKYTAKSLGGIALSLRPPSRCLP
jgi:hypothetical protein